MLLIGVQICLEIPVQYKMKNSTQQKKNYIKKWKITCFRFGKATWTQTAIVSVVLGFERRSNDWRFWIFIKNSIHSNIQTHNEFFFLHSNIVLFHKKLRIRSKCSIVDRTFLKPMTINYYGKLVSTNLKQEWKNKNRYWGDQVHTCLLFILIYWVFSVDCLPC